MVLPDCGGDGSGVAAGLRVLVVLPTCDGRGVAGLWFEWVVAALLDCRSKMCYPRVWCCWTLGVWTVDPSASPTVVAGVDSLGGDPTNTDPIPLPPQSII